MKLSKGINVAVKALPNNEVMVRNYRCSDMWERGEVIGLKIHVNQYGFTRCVYSVWVSRTPKNPRGKLGYCIEVSNAGIKKVKQK